MVTASTVERDSAPPGLRLTLALVAVPSAAGILGVVVSPEALTPLGWIQPVVSALSLVACWGALHRRAWGFWSLVALLLANTFASLAFDWTVGDILAPLFFGALAFAVFSNRRWYSKRPSR